MIEKGTVLIVRDPDSPKAGWELVIRKIETWPNLIEEAGMSVRYIVTAFNESAELVDNSMEISGELMARYLNARTVVIK